MIKKGSSILIISIVLILSFSVIDKEPVAVVQNEEKIGVLIFDNNPQGYEYRIDALHIIDEILNLYGYHTYIVDNFSDFRDYYAERIVVVHLGHGANTSIAHVFFNNTYYPFEPDIMQYLHAQELILLNDACYAGSWLSLSEKGRLIIGDVNRTLSLYIGAGWSPYNLSSSIGHLLLIAHERGLSLEAAYKIWEDEILLPWYKHVSEFGMDGKWKDAITWHPVIFDGIEGDVWL